MGRELSLVTNQLLAVLQPAIARANPLLVQEIVAAVAAA